MNPSIAMFCLLLRGRNSFVLPFFEICLLNQRAAEDPFGFAVLYGALVLLAGILLETDAGRTILAKKEWDTQRRAPSPNFLKFCFYPHGFDITPGKSRRTL